MLLCRVGEDVPLTLRFITRPFLNAQNREVAGNVYLHGLISLVIVINVALHPIAGSSVVKIRAGIFQVSRAFSNCFTNAQEQTKIVELQLRALGKAYAHDGFQLHVVYKIETIIKVTPFSRSLHLTNIRVATKNESRTFNRRNNCRHWSHTQEWDHSEKPYEPIPRHGKILS